MEDRFGIPLLFCGGDGIFHITVYGRIQGKISVDKPLGLGAGGMDILRQRERTDAVYDAEIDRLRFASELGRHVFFRNAEHLRRCHGMHVHAPVEAVQHILIVRKRRQHAELDLRIVGVHKHVSVARGKELPEFTPELGAHRDVLQIRLRGRKPAGSRFCLVERGMDAPVRTDGFQQALAIGAFELCVGAVFEDIRNNGIIVRKAFQHFRVGRPAGFRLLFCRKTELFK